MDTAQTVLSQGAATSQRQALVPWIIGGVVLIVALFVISRL